MSGAPRRPCTLLAAAVLLGGCTTLPADRPLAPGAVSVTVLDRDALSGKVGLAVENHSRERLAYLWYHVTLSPTPTIGKRENPYDLRVDGKPAALVMHDIPLGPGRRQIIGFDCPGDGLCRNEDQYVGIHVCREQSSYCADYEIVWSTTTIARARTVEAR